MSQTFLEMITAKTRERIARLKSERYIDAFRKKAEQRRAERPAHALHAPLSQTDRVNIIAEIKRASPSKGVINANIDPAAQAKRYVAGGAAAISVLTEPEHFLGSINDLIKVRSSADVPILRKDFIVDEYQIYEAAAAGADAVLLIVAALPPNELSALRKVAEDDLGLDALVEVHTANEMQTAADAGARLIGVNNRDLHSLEVSLNISRLVISRKPEGALMIAESGISTRDEIDELKALGFDGFLIGEALMRDPGLLASLSGGAL